MINAGGKRWLYWNSQWNENKACCSEEQNEKWLAGKQLTFAMVLHLWTLQQLLSLCFSQFCFFPKSYTANNKLLRKRTNLPNGEHHATGVQYPAQKWKGGAGFILPPPCETSWQWEHLEGSVQRAQRAKTSCPADVTPRNSRFVTHFQKMKWDWQIHHERAPRPRGTALRYCCSPFAGATVGQLETRRWRCASPKRFLPYFSSERGQQGQNGPMGRPNITIKVPPCFLG